MAERDVAKAFNRLHAKVSSLAGDADLDAKRREREREQAQVLAKDVAPTTSEACIPWVLEAWADKQYFRLLGLPAVEVDALGRPTWECTDADIAQAYRKLAILVHPDKTSHLDHPRSREAFENLNAAHRILKDPGKRADEMAKQLENARKRRTLLEANATGAERLALNAERVAQAAQLRQEESSKLHARTKGHMERAREAAAQKRKLREQAEERHLQKAHDAGNAKAGHSGAQAPTSAQENDSDEEAADATAKRRARARNNRKRVKM